MFVIKLEYKFISREETLSGTFWWLPRIWMPSPRKVEWSICLSVPRQVAKRDTLGSQEGPSGTGLKNTLRPLPIYEHGQSSEHCINVDSFSNVGRQAQGITRIPKKAIFIRVSDTSLNRNLAKLQLPYIWDEVIQIRIAKSLHSRRTDQVCLYWTCVSVISSTILQPEMWKKDSKFQLVKAMETFFKICTMKALDANKLL